MTIEKLTEINEAIEWLEEKLNNTERRINMKSVNESLVRTGWICPKCGKVLAPTMVECIYCNMSDADKSNVGKWNVTLTGAPSDIASAIPITTTTTTTTTANSDKDECECGCDCKCGNSCSEEDSTKKSEQSYTEENIEEIGILLADLFGNVIRRLD